MTVDDITKFKKDGVEDEGLIDLSHKDAYKPGITRSDMRAAQVLCLAFAISHPILPIGYVWHT